VTEIIQGSEEWLQMRAGKVTASRISDVMARDRSGKNWGKTRDTYMGELIAEILSGVPSEGFSNATMARGNEIEPDARNAYAFLRDANVTEVAFVDHPTIEKAGASPDGLVDDDGLVEFKCPNTSTHIDTIIKKKIAGNYIKQMQWQMACTERLWCDFVSYDPRLPPQYRFYVQRVPRDDAAISELESGVREFLADIEAKINELKEAA